MHGLYSGKLKSSFVKSNKFLQNFENKVKEISDFSNDSEKEEVKIDISQEFPNLADPSKQKIKNQLEEIIIKHNPFSRKNTIKEPKSTKFSIMPSNIKNHDRLSEIIFKSSSNSPVIRKSFHISNHKYQKQGRNSIDRPEIE